MIRYRDLIFLLSCAILISCGKKQSEENPNLFELLLADETGINFENTVAETDSFNFIQYLYFYDGGGVAVGDINNDGLTDIYFTANQNDNKLYLNKGNLEFEDITDKAGVAGFGSWTTGVTMADVNADGHLDIYVCQVGDYKSVQGRNQLYINNGDLTFTEKAEEYGIDFKGFSTHASFFDYDKDGDLDLYLLNHSVHTSRSYGKASLRMDHDEKAGDILYRNDFMGTPNFVDVTEGSGIYNSQIGYGLSISVSDVNYDGWPDIYVANDFHENDYLYINNKDGTFSEIISEAFGHTSRSSMGNDVADFNNDGLLDIVVLDMLPGQEEILKSAAGDDPYDIHKIKLDYGYHYQFVHNTLQLNQGIMHNKPYFSDVAMMAGVHATDWSWAALFCDLDLDGWKDIYITNGIYKRPNDLDYLKFISAGNMGRAGRAASQASDKELSDKMPSVPIANYAYHNTGALSFKNKATEWGLDQPGFSNGAAYSDLDNDGDLELVVNNVNGKAFVYKNNAVEADTVNFLKITLRASNENTRGIGSKVIIKDRGNIQYQEVMPSRGYQSAVDTDLVFGLDDNKKIDTLIVVWPDDKYNITTNVDANQHLTFNHEGAVGQYNYQKPLQSGKSRRKFFEQVKFDNTLFEHQENDYVDFSREILMPHMLSREGPPIAVADVNGDGKEDFYIGGATGQAGELFIQTRDSFERSTQSDFSNDKMHEDIDAIFFDVDGDGDQDLHVSSGGNEYFETSAYIRDRLYFNDGKGNFTRAQNYTSVAANSGCARASDYDNDGDLDLFIGVRNKVAGYGIPPSSYLLQNNGKGTFKDVTDKDFPGLKNLGMVTDAEWIDLNNDDYKDLIIVGEWMSVQIFMNNKGSFKLADIPELAQVKGWWNEIEVADMDEDGDMDFVVGNLGLNTKLKATDDQPIEFFVEDFDNSGNTDPILSYGKNGKRYPLATFNQLQKQLPFLRQKFVSYRDFAGSTIEEIFSKEQLRQAIHHEANELRTCFFEQVGELQFKIKSLPPEAQVAPVYGIHIEDLNNDGLKDIALGGNFTGLDPHMGRYDASYGITLLNDENKSFQFVGSLESGLHLKGEVRNIMAITHQSLGKMLIVSRNDNGITFFRISDYTHHISSARKE